MIKEWPPKQLGSSFASPTKWSLRNYDHHKRDKDNKSATYLCFTRLLRMVHHWRSFLTKSGSHIRGTILYETKLLKIIGKPDGTNKRSLLTNYDVLEVVGLS